MKIIDDRTVELTDAEKRAHGLFDRMLDQGYTTIQAATRTEEVKPGLDPAFYRWLRDEPLMPETNDRLAAVLDAVQFAREQLEVVFQDRDMPPRLARAHERLEGAAVILLNNTGATT